MKTWLVVLGILLIPIGLLVSNLAITRPKWGNIEIGPYRVGVEEAVPLDYVGLLVILAGGFIAIVGAIAGEDTREEMKKALEALDRMWAEGLLTEEEYEKKKRAIIAKYA